MTQPKRWPSVRLARRLGSHLGEAQHVIAAAGRYVLLAQAGDVPDAHSLVQRGRHDQVLLRVERGAHDVVVVARQHGHARPALPVPQPDGLVVAGGHHPRVLCMELHRPDVVQVPQQREETATQLVVPHLDLVVVAWTRVRGRRRVKQGRTVRQPYSLPRAATATHHQTQTAAGCGGSARRGRGRRARRSGR